MTKPQFDQYFWEQQWSKTLRADADRDARGAASRRASNGSRVISRPGRPRPIDPVTGGATAAANQVQVSFEAAAAVLDRPGWELVVAEERPRAASGTGVDAVTRACRRS